MSDNRRGISGEPNGLSDLSTENLEELIRTVSLEEDIDVAFLDSLLEAYGSREGVPQVDTDAAWERFQRDYSGTSEIYPLDNAGNTTQTISTNPQRNHRRRIRLKRALITAAIVIGVLLAGTITASALGYDVLGAVAKWTRDTFVFTAHEGSEPKGANLPGDFEYASLEEAIAMQNISDLLAPTWIPDGFVLSDLTVDNTPNHTLVNSFYECSDRSLAIQILILHNSSSTKYEKDANPISVYELKGIEHFVMTNNSQINVAWAYNNYECSINGDISEDDAIKMIESIYER